MTDAERLAKAGRLLYGDWWHTQMADSLGVARRTVQRWANGEQAVPPRVWPDIRALLLEHSKAAQAFAEKLAA